MGRGTIGPMLTGRDGAPVIVVGAGLSGLTCALRLAEGGVAVTVLEAAEEVGGRARTLSVGERVVDRGFQSLFSAYPRTSRLLRDVGIRRRDLIAFDRGAVVHDGSSWDRMSASPAGVLRFRAFSAGDVRRLAALGAEVAGIPSARVLAGDERHATALEYLRARGFTERAIEGFFRPLFGVITADRDLGSDAAYLRFLIQMMLRGPAVIPVEGHGMISRWAAARVRQLGGEVRTGARVAGIVPSRDDRGHARGVAVDGAGLVAAAVVVVATEAPEARSLLAELDRQCARALDVRPRGVTTLAYELDASFHSGKAIILNAEAESGTARIDLVCQESNLLPAAPADAGARLLATSVDGPDGAAEPGALEAAMTALAGRWNPGFPWSRCARLVEVVRHPWAQFAVPPGARDALPGQQTAVGNVLLAGDITMHPSIEGAVVAGERAALTTREVLAATHSAGGA